MADVRMAGARHQICVHVPRSRCSWAPVAITARPIARPRRADLDDRDANAAGRTSHVAGGLKARVANAGNTLARTPIGHARAAMAKATTATGSASCPGDDQVSKVRPDGMPDQDDLARPAGGEMCLHRPGVVLGDKTVITDFSTL